MVDLPKKKGLISRPLLFNPRATTMCELEMQTGDSWKTSQAHLTRPPVVMTWKWLYLLPDRIEHTVSQTTFE
jgi:hypothetical protein